MVPEPVVDSLPAPVFLTEPDSNSGPLLVVDKPWAGTPTAACTGSPLRSASTVIASLLS